MIDPEEAAQEAADVIDDELDDAIIDALAPEKEAVRVGDAIARDLTLRKGIGLYLDELRTKATGAIKAFPDIDLDDKAGLRTCQEAVRMWLHAFGFVRERLVNAESAAATIEREVGNGLIPAEEGENRDDG